MSIPQQKRPYRWRDQKYYFDKEQTQAGNVNFELEAGIGEKIKVLYGKVDLTTSADVANRTVQPFIHNFAGSPVLKFVNQATATTASTSNALIYFINSDTYGDTSDLGGGFSDVALLGVPHGAIYEKNKFVIKINNGHANDSYIVTLQYLKVPINETFPPGE